ncbi:MAG TPA: UDP-N-acetylmuramoyl-tripeptide--D-alanyl-D-alanine ligase [Cytophagales bacterium]|jgi:UDP-N-acetylmuramoyl-tripeptide--D-alanyl-D-alanine ligase|nr:UDP-N-acetylmuramoyl-tripeptide--D-alanyl-D-alanine ligase [Cytophagales bacterium]
MIEQLYQHFLKSTGVSTDTRTIKSGNIFFALKGPNFNANAFAEKAIEKGAGLAVIDDQKHKKDDRYFVVDDTLSALQNLAIHYRKQWDIPVLALTGSNGKTTTKELMNLVLRQKYKVHTTTGNLNNHIGVPLTILAKPAGAELVILEMGANRVGDIAELCRIGQPTHGLITNIGKAHIGYFGGYEGVIRGKSEMYHYLIQHEGVIFVNTRQEVLKKMARRMRNPVFYPEKGSFYPATLISANPFVHLKTESGKLLKTHMVGGFNFDNIATALCIGKYFGIPEDDMIKVLSGYSPQNNRSQIMEKGGNTILMDAYNANPTSMKAALETLQLMEGKSKVAILGDMFELGEDSANEHADIGTFTAQMNLEMALLCGKDMQYAAAKNEKSQHFLDRKSLIEYLDQQKWSGKTILIKGSRGMALEKIIDHL